MLVGTTTRQIAGAANAAIGGTRVVYVAAHMRHAAYCADIAREVLGGAKTPHRYRVGFGAGEVVFTSYNSDPWPTVHGHRDVDIIVDHAAPYLAPRRLAQVWHDAIEYVEYRKGMKHADEPRRPTRKREHLRKKLWRKLVNYVALLGSSLRRRKVSVPS